MKTSISQNKVIVKANGVVGPQGPKGGFETAFTGDAGISGSLSIHGNQLITGSLTVSGSGTLENIGPFNQTGISTLIGETVISGSLNVTGGITGSIFGTATSASFAVTASHALFAVSASHEITFEISSSHALTANTASFAISSSLAQEASNNFETISYNNTTFNITAIRSNGGQQSAAITNVPSASHAHTASFAGNLFGTPSITVNHITASGNISASGDIFANDITLNGLGVSDKPNVILKRGSVTGAELKMGSGGNDAGILRLNNTAGGQDILLQAQGISYFSQSLKIGVAYDYPETNPATLTVGGNISSSGAFHTLSHITSSGNINASGHLEGGGLKIDNAEIFAGPSILKLQSGSDATDSAAVLRTSNERLLINSAGAFDTIEALNAGLIATNITASGAISASGVINGQNLFGGVFGRIYPDSAQTSNNQFFTANANGINSNSSFTVTGNVTASGNISASGEIETNKFVSNGVDVAQFAAGAVQLGGGILQPTALSGTGITLGITGQNQPVTVISALTASIISASGHLAVNDVHANNFRLMTPADAAGSFPMIKTTGNHQASTAKIFIGDADEFDTNSHILIDPPNESATFLELNTTISGSLLVRENATLQGGRPITTHTTSPISSSLTNAGRYHIVGGNLTCSIVQSTAVIGAEYEFFQTSSAGNFLFESASGITVISKNGSMRLAQQGSAAVLKKVNSTIYHLMGDLT